MLNINAKDIIDNAYDITSKRHPEYTLSSYRGALKQYLYHFDDPRRADGFSGPARNSFNTLSKDDIYSELLRNIIKLKAYRDINGERQALSISDSYSPDMHPLEKDEWLFHQIMYYPLEGINEMMIFNDDILNSLIDSYFSSRYFSSINKDELDNLDNLTDDEYNCLNAVNNFYNKNTYGRR